MSVFDYNFLQMFKERKNSLKPTHTVVRSIPIISDGWEEEAVKKCLQTEKSDNDIKLRMLEFEKSICGCKKNLRPTNTVISNLPAVFFQEEEVPVSPNDTPQDPQFLVPDYGWEEMHGFRGSCTWDAPRKISHCDMEARPGYASRLAHEYQDTPSVLQAKIDVLARLVQQSRNCVAYTGAGISTASGINDFATKASSHSSGRPRLHTPLEAKPTLGHRALVSLYRSGFLKYWVQQNHDGLPQKAGMPQHCLNEIHGSWYDPTNPVVAMNGSLRSDLFEDMRQWEKRADLTLAIGTSMCGMNSDRVFTNVANRGRQALDMPAADAEGQENRRAAIGGVIISLQQTQFDHLSALRIFAPIDDVMVLLGEKLGLQLEDERGEPRTPKGDEEEDVYCVPYDRGGCRLPRHQMQHQSTILDLRVGSRVRLSLGPYAGDEGTVLGKNLEGHYRIQFMHKVSLTNTPRPFESVMGSWWVDAAVEGSVPLLPVYNV